MWLLLLLTSCHCAAMAHCLHPASLRAALQMLQGIERRLSRLLLERPAGLKFKKLKDLPW